MINNFICFEDAQNNPNWQTDVNDLLLFARKQVNLK
jgi:hypothetical protein